MCQFDWAKRCPESWWNMISGCVWGYFWKRWAFRWVGWVQIPLTGVQPHPIHGSLSRAERWRGGIYSLPEPKRDLLLPSHIRAHGPQAFRLRGGLRPAVLWFSGLWTRMELHYPPSWVSGLRGAEREASQPPWLRGPIPRLNLVVHILVLFLWRTLIRVCVCVCVCVLKTDLPWPRIRLYPDKSIASWKYH